MLPRRRQEMRIDGGVSCLLCSLTLKRFHWANVATQHALKDFQCTHGVT
jgi:hypothetical protein